MTTDRPPYPCGNGETVFRETVSRIAWIPGVERIILFGSYAKGTQTESSDVDLAVFVNTDKPCLIEEYRALSEICRSAELDIQVQVFHMHELDAPCGIIEEIVTYGVDIPVCRNGCRESERNGASGNHGRDIH